MQPILKLLAIVLIIFGVVSLAYQGITYTTREKVAEIGSVQITAEDKKVVYFPPLLGALSLAAGIVILYLSRNKK